MKNSPEPVPARTTARPARRVSIVARAITLGALGLIILGAALYGSAYAILTHSFQSLESKLLSEDLDRAVNSVAAEVSALDAVTQEWATWDEMCRFIADRNQDFVQTNLTEDAFVRARATAIVVLDPAGNRVYSGSVEPESKTVREAAPPLLAAILATPALVRHERADSSKAGILLLDGAPTFIASRPAVAGSGTGPVRGAVLIARALDGSMLARLSEQTRLQLSARTLASPDDEWARAAAAIREGAPLFIEAVDANHITGFATVRDISGSSGVLVRVDKDRAVAASGRAALVYLGLALLVLGLICGVFGLLLHRRVIRLLHGMVNRLRESVESLRTAASGVSEVSEALAGRTAEQTTSLEHAAHSLRDLVSATESNNARVSNVDRLVKSAGADAGKAGERIEALQTTMRDVATSGAQMRGVVKAIEEIAFSTKLLALNAAVEAARAGSAGQGFAVVADEVGRLAESSSAAAQNTAELIEAAVRSIRAGADTAAEVVAQFNEASRTWQSATSLLAAVNESVAREVEQIQAVDRATSQIGSAAQDNGTAAREAASSASRLESETQQVAGVVAELIALVGTARER